jgi:hypothetical protein
MNTIQVIAKKMIEAGKPGSIVNVSTIVNATSEHILSIRSVSFILLLL